MTSHSGGPRRSRFAQTDAEAQARFGLHSSEAEDPFPSILPALLNSADIEDYISATGMVYPFDPGNGKLKSASYEIDLLGECLYWDDKGEPQTFNLQKGQKFSLKKNSIAFVSPDTKFRIPDYIALRFNLKITHVHRGIILGTGPLIDPGFEGKLVIPLHNLTTNDYELEGGEGLIWVEFTKLSSSIRNAVRNDRYPKQGAYIKFPPDKKNLSMSYYLHKAAPHDSIRSSIPDAIQDARVSAKAALNTVKGITIAGLISALIVSYTIYDSFKQSASLVQDATVYIKDARQEVNELKDEIRFLKQEIQELKKRPAQPSK